MSSAYQLVELRASQAGHLACFVDRAGEALGEWNHFRFPSLRSGRSKLRLLRPILFSSTVVHVLSCLHKTRQDESWLRARQRQCEHQTAVARSSAHQRSFAELRISMTAR